MSKRLPRALGTVLLTTLVVTLGWTSLATAAPVKGGALTSGKPVDGAVRKADGISFTFKAVANQHVTINVTHPHVTPAGNRLQMKIYDSSNAQDVGTVYITTEPVHTDFTPTAAQAGNTTIVISPYDSAARGTFTISYARDVEGGALTNGVAATAKTKFPGQHVNFTLTAVTAQHITFNVTHPHLTPVGDRMQMNIYNSSGSQDVGTVLFGTSPVHTDFTPTAAQAGNTRIVVAPYDATTVGSFTLSYAHDVDGGTLKNAVATTAKTKFPGQRVNFSLKVASGRHLTVNVTQPQLSPVGHRFQMNIYNSSGSQDVGTVVFGTSPVHTDFTPTAAQAGTTTIVVSPYDSDATGSFTISYANDIDGGTLAKGKAVTTGTTFPGQHVVFSFSVVSGRHVTVSITHPHLNPTGHRFQMNIYDSSGGQDVGTVVFGTDPAQAAFTPTADQAGNTKIVISPYDSDVTGSFTIKYTG